MKKFLVLSSLLTVLTVIAAPVKMIPFNTMDVATINTALTAAQNSAETPALIVIKLTILKNVREKNVKTFAALQTEVNTVVDQFVAAGKITETQGASYKILLTKQFALVSFFGKPAFTVEETKAMVKAGWEFAKLNPSNYDVSYITNAYKLLDLTDKEAYLEILSQIKKYNGNIIGGQTESLKAVKLFVKLAATVDVTTQKADLQTLNRIYSPKLLVNKTAWEPVVAIIRTALETY